MTEYKFTISKSEYSAEGNYDRPAFALFRPESNLHESITASLSDFYLIQGNDIRFNQDVNPLANANVIYDLIPFNGFARISIDRAQIALLSPHVQTTDQIIALSLAFFNGVKQVTGDISFNNFIIQSGFHAELESISPTEFIATHISPKRKAIDSIIGHSVTYYLGQEGQRSSSSVTLDISDEIPEHVFVRILLRYDGDQIQIDDLPDSATRHYAELLSLIDLEST